VSDFTEDFVSDVLEFGFRRCEAARMVGGIAAQDVFEGTLVPSGWQYDMISEYYVPSLDVLDAAAELH
jgi:hypothetical protein